MRERPWTPSACKILPPLRLLSIIHGTAQRFVRRRLQGIRLDLVVAPAASSNFPSFIHFQNGSAGFGNPVSFYAPVGSNFIGSAVVTPDLNNDSRPDVVVGLSGPLVHYNSIHGLSVNPVSYSLGGGKAMLTRDMDNDGWQDIVFGDRITRLVRGSSAGLSAGPSIELEPLIPFGPPGPKLSAKSMALGDLNGDACNDVVLADGRRGAFFVRGSSCQPGADLATFATWDGSTAIVEAVNIASSDPASGTVTVTFLLFGKLDSRKSECTQTVFGRAIAVFECNARNLQVGERARYEFFATAGSAQASVSATVTGPVIDPTPENNASRAWTP